MFLRRVRKSCTQPVRNFATVRDEPISVGGTIVSPRIDMTSLQVRNHGGNFRTPEKPTSELEQSTRSGERIQRLAIVCEALMQRSIFIHPATKLRLKTLQPTAISFSTAYHLPYFPAVFLTARCRSFLGSPSCVSTTGRRLTADRSVPPTPPGACQPRPLRSRIAHPDVQHVGTLPRKAVGSGEKPSMMHIRCKVYDTIVVWPFGASSTFTGGSARRGFVGQHGCGKEAEPF